MNHEPLVLSEQKERVVQLTLNNPGKRNAMNYAMVEALTQALEAVDADPEARVVTIAGAGDNFSAGGDLKEFAAELEMQAFQHWQAADPWIKLFRLARTMRVPIIAAVHGYALAGGCGLVALSDMAIAADDAKLGTTEIRIGLFPMIILPALRRVVGERKALEMSLSGQMYGAQEALQMGLVNQVVPKQDLMAATLDLASSIATKGPAAIAMGKRLFYATADMGYEDALEFARSIRVAYMLADDVAEGVDAFLNKRKPDWR